VQFRTMLASECEQVHMSRKESLKIFHATSWNVPSVFFCQVELIYDVVKSWNILPHHMRDLLGESTMIY